MIRTMLLAAAVLLLGFQHYVQPITEQVQMIIFLSGIILLGVPHGAADLLVANQNADHSKLPFSKVRFFVNYLGRLVLFAVFIWLFPLAGNLLFIVFAAYHFGETDLHEFKTNSIAGKIFVISYGLLILGVILLQHFEELRPMFQLFDAGLRHASFINWLDQNRYVVLSFCALFFFIATFYYFSCVDIGQYHSGKFLLQLAVLLLVLYYLPMTLGFSFYFIAWHSILSLRNIVQYLRKNNLYSFAVIAKQIGLYSFLALAGISIFGLSGFMFANNNAMMVYVFLGLAVLTAPHMQIMHDMYKSIRANHTNNNALPVPK
ncbi:MAG TPA: Brp/Blh family beta-carotene 15,15'-dioxygenase [Ferruginibacter sp.]|nr:Brp/Blh family beta-carotene 15,15'-dioxygenase [Ferruginibacter sp.]